MTLLLILGQSMHQYNFIEQWNPLKNHAHNSFSCWDTLRWWRQITSTAHIHHRLKTGIGLMLNVWLQMAPDIYPRFLPRTPVFSASRRPRTSCCTGPIVTIRPRPRTWGHWGTSPPPGHSPHRDSRTGSPRCRTRGHCRCCRWGRSCKPRSSRSIPARMKNYTTFTKWIIGLSVNLIGNLDTLLLQLIGAYSRYELLSWHKSRPSPVDIITSKPRYWNCVQPQPTWVVFCHTIWV